LRLPPNRLCGKEYRIRHRRTFGIEQGIMNDEVEKTEDRKRRAENGLRRRAGDG